MAQAWAAASQPQASSPPDRSSLQASPRMRQDLIVHWSVRLLSPPAPALAQQSTMVQQPSFFQQAIGYGAQGLGIAANLGWKPFK